MFDLVNVLASINTKGTYTCGGLNIDFTGMLPNAVSIVVKIIWIAVPVLLVIFGLLDLAKAVMAQKEDEIKKGQQTLVKRVIAALIVFFVISIVRVLIGWVSGDDETVVNCFNCFVNGEVGAKGCDSQGAEGM